MRWPSLLRKSTESMAGGQSFNCIVLLLVPDACLAAVPSCGFVCLLVCCASSASWVGHC
jgi:hypothetical protein